MLFVWNLNCSLLVFGFPSISCPASPPFIRVLIKGPRTSRKNNTCLQDDQPIDNITLKRNRKTKLQAASA
jgi:hypothetical protein